MYKNTGLFGRWSDKLTRSVDRRQFQMTSIKSSLFRSMLIGYNLRIGLSRNFIQQKLWRKESSQATRWETEWPPVCCPCQLKKTKKPNDQRHKTMTSGQRSVWLPKPVPAVDVWPASWYGRILLFLVGWATQSNELCYRRTLIQSDIKKKVLIPFSKILFHAPSKLNVMCFGKWEQNEFWSIWKKSK